MTPEELFGALFAAEPARPFITYYDEASGERVELSVRSLANWIAKTHYLLVDELGLGVGDAALIALPAHWISVPAVLGCLTAGLSLSDNPAVAAVAFVQPASASTAREVPDVYAVAPASAATGFGDGPPAGSNDTARAGLPSGTNDFVTAVRPQADAWTGVRFSAVEGDPCLPGRSRGQVVAWAHERADELGLTPGARLLTTRDWTGVDDWLDTLLLPLALGGSVVYVRNTADEAIIERRMTQERATARV